MNTLNQDTLSIYSNFQEQNSNIKEFCQISSNQRSKNLIDYKKAFEIFIQQLGASKDIPLDLEPYKFDFAQTKIQMTVDQPFIRGILDNILRKMSVNKKQKKNWSKDDFILMLWIIQKYCGLNGKDVQECNQDDWEKISSLIPGKNNQQCMFKWLGLKKNKYSQKFPWSDTQDRLLKQFVNQQNPNHWFDVSKKIYLQNNGFKVYRNPKQCRQRWACFLNPKLKKGPWCPSEDLILLSKYLQIGKKWSSIAKLLNGRTENAVKNRFSLILQKKEKLKNKMSDAQFIKNHMQNLELNSFVKTSDSTTHLDFSTFSTQMEQKFFPSKETKNFLDQSTVQIKSLKSLKQFFPYQKICNQVAREATPLKTICFKKISIEQLQKLEFEIFPAQFNEEQKQISYKQVKPVLESNKQKQCLIDYEQRMVENYFEDNLRFEDLGQNYFENEIAY